MSRKHSPYGASSSERWLNCPGSVKLSESAPEQAPSKYADEGTKAHAILAAGLSAITEGWPVARKPGSEMHQNASWAIDIILPKLSGAKLFIEQKVSIAPEIFGTLDVGIWTPTKLTVMDYKYGKHLAVPATGNTQLMFYALGLANEVDMSKVDTIELCILQPRAIKQFDTWIVSAIALKSWQTMFDEGIARGQLANAILNPGSWCMFCPAKKICPMKKGSKGYGQA